MGPATRTVTLEGRFPMYRGGFLESPTLAYETWGELSDDRDNGILIFSGLSPSAHAASSADDPSPGWWEEMIGPGLPFDTNRFFVIAVNSLGSCFGSTGPASVNPDTGEIYRLDFPVLTMEDLAESARGVVEHLGIEQLYSVVGNSMGGKDVIIIACPDAEHHRACANTVGSCEVVINDHKALAQDFNIGPTATS